jgi:hypothetical protein
VDDTSLNAAVKHSVEWQECHLYGRCSTPTSRRSSVSSLGSILTELTDSGDDGQALSEFPEVLPLLPLTSSDVDAPNEARERAETVPEASGGGPTRQGRRRKRRRIGRQVRMEGERSAASFERAIRVPYEFDDLKASMKPLFGERVHRHDELGRLGIRTVGWDGRSVHSAGLRVAAPAHSWPQ